MPFWYENMTSLSEKKILPVGDVNATCMGGWNRGREMRALNQRLWYINPGSISLETIFPGNNGR